MNRWPTNKELQEASKYANKELVALDKEWGDVWLEEDLAYIGTKPYEDSYIDDLFKVRKARYLQYIAEYLDKLPT